MCNSSSTIFDLRTPLKSTKYNSLSGKNKDSLIKKLLDSNIRCSKTNGIAHILEICQIECLNPLDYKLNLIKYAI